LTLSTIALPGGGSAAARAKRLFLPCGPPRGLIGVIGNLRLQDRAAAHAGSSRLLDALNGPIAALAIERVQLVEELTAQTHVDSYLRRQRC